MIYREQHDDLGETPDNYRDPMYDGGGETTCNKCDCWLSASDLMEGGCCKDCYLPILQENIWVQFRGLDYHASPDARWSWEQFSVDKIKGLIDTHYDHKTNIFTDVGHWYSIQNAIWGVGYLFTGRAKAGIQFAIQKMSNYEFAGLIAEIALNVESRTSSGVRDYINDTYNAAAYELLIINRDEFLTFENIRLLTEAGFRDDLA